MINLEKLGKRISIIGCSCSGKSTLAKKLSDKLIIPAHYLDQLAHYPNTNWQRSSDQALIAAHNDILKQDQWIIDGNYSICMPERLAAATAVVWLDMNVLSSAVRYLTRSIQNDPQRAGRLSGAKSEFNFFLLKHILITYPKNRIKYQHLLKAYDGKSLCITNMASLTRHLKHWNLQ